MFWCLLAIVSAQFFRLFSRKCRGESLLLSGLGFCDFSENFSGASFCFEVTISALLVLVRSSHRFCAEFFGFSPANVGEIFSFVIDRSGFLRPFSGKVPGANFCFEVSISALRVLVPSSHSFSIFFRHFSRKWGGKLTSCQVWFSATFFGKIFGSELLFQRLDLWCAVFGAF